MARRKTTLPEACRRIMAEGHDCDRSRCNWCGVPDSLCGAPVYVPEGWWPPPPGGWVEYRDDPTPDEPRSLLTMGYEMGSE